MAWQEVEYNIDDLTVEFTEASTRANISSGESVKTIFGKIKKWFTDLTLPLPITKGGTGQTTRLDACKVLTNENVAEPTFVVGLTNQWANFGYTSISNLKTALGTVTPSAHAATATTYGAGTASNYGHVKLSDSYTSSGGAASASVGASSKAVYDAYTACAKKTVAQSFTATNTFAKAVAPTASTYASCPVVVSGMTSSESSGRACIGFHNNGSNAGTLYLDTDGSLKFITNGGSKYKINMTAIT